MPFDYLNHVQSTNQHKGDDGKDADLIRVLHDIIKNKKIVELVKLMQPMDVMRSLTDSLSIQPKKAAHLMIGLLCHVNEWSFPPGEPSSAKSYPGKPGEDVTDRDARIKDYLPNEIEEYSNFSPKLNYKSNAEGEGPAAQTIQRSAPWPYGAYNVSLMDPHNKSSESLPVGSANNVATSIKAIGGNANKAMGGSGQGTFQKGDPHSTTGTMAMNGNVFGGRGVPGLSGSPQDKEFNTPEESENGNKSRRPRRENRKSTESIG